MKVRHIFKGTGDLAFADAKQVDAVLQAVEAEAHHYYNPVRVRPWVFASFGRPGAEMCADIRRLARLRLRRPDVARAVSVQSVLQLLLQRWRAELSCSLIRGDAAVYTAAMEGKGGRTRRGGSSLRSCTCTTCRITGCPAELMDVLTLRT